MFVSCSAPAFWFAYFPSRLKARLTFQARLTSTCSVGRPSGSPQVLQLIVNYQDYQIDEMGRELDDRDAAEASRG